MVRHAAPGGGVPEAAGRAIGCRSDGRRQIQSKLWLRPNSSRSMHQGAVGLPHGAAAAPDRRCARARESARRFPWPPRSAPTRSANSARRSSTGPSSASSCVPCASNPFSQTSPSSLLPRAMSVSAMSQRSSVWPLPGSITDSANQRLVKALSSDCNASAGAPAVCASRALRPAC